MADKKLSRRDFLKAASTALAASGFAALPVGLVRAQDDEVSIELWGFANNRDEWMHNVVDELWSDMHPNVNVSLSLTPYSEPVAQAASGFRGRRGHPRHGRHRKSAPWGSSSATPAASPTQP